MSGPLIYGTKGAKNHAPTYGLTSSASALERIAALLAVANRTGSLCGEYPGVAGAAKTFDIAARDSGSRATESFMIKVTD